MYKKGVKRFVIQLFDRPCKLISAPVLRFPTFSESFIVEVDASDFAIGGILSQKQNDGAIHPVAYFLNTLDASKQKWSTYTKEAFALVATTRHWYNYLASKPFIMLSDHNPFTHTEGSAW